MLRARQQQQRQRSASSTEVQQQLQATPCHCQGMQGSAPLCEAELEHGKRWEGWVFNARILEIFSNALSLMKYS